MEQLNKTKLNYSGIYKITSLISGKFYIGSATNFYFRFHHHIWAFNHNKHHSKHLQNSWTKYGEENFQFEILARCPKEYLIKLEQWFIDNMKPEYNSNPVAGSLLGFKKSEKSKRKQSEKIKGRKYTFEHRKNMSLSGKGRKVSEERKKSMSEKWKGHKRSQDSIDKQFIKRKVKIVQLNDKKELIKIWDGIKDVEKVYGGQIQYNLKTKTKKYNFYWDYLINFNFNNIISDLEFDIN